MPQRFIPIAALLLRISYLVSWSGLILTDYSGYGYLYPRDRDMFEDSELGMEQKAFYFLVIIEVLLKFMTSEKDQ